VTAARPPLLDGVLARVTPGRLEAAAVAVTSIPSPTSREAELARWLCGQMQGAGIAAEVQHLDEDQANAVGRIRGQGTGSDLMLYAPIDTLTTGDPGEDLPWIGAALRPDMLPQARSDGTLVTGLGAGNPKGHAACVLVTGLAVAEALREHELALPGDLVLAFGAGGMPTNAIGAAPARANTGHGVGVSFLLERGWYTDAAVIAKPGDFVAHDEVGLCWFEITVRGIHTYAGSRHRLPYRNPIVDAARLIERLERWLEDYPARHRTPTAAPQGIIGSAAGGWERMLAVTPAACRIRLDLRLAPGETPMQLKREVAAATAGFAGELGLELSVEMALSIPSSRTDPGEPIIRRAVEAWEQASGRPHQPAADSSGATDANILRHRGIPTARVGMAKVDAASADFSLGMNTVDVSAMRRLCAILGHVVVTSTAEPA
jgi:acetylornithine deacetylase/succinyl-diaminopimelate desuccinylase-like protein